MEKMNGNELRIALIEKNLISADGVVNTLTVNCISGAHTLPLLSEVWDLYQNDADTMKDLLTFLNDINKMKQFDILAGIVKILYNFCGLFIPEVIQMIFNCEEKEIQELYYHEFLEDFQDIMYDLLTEAEL